MLERGIEVVAERTKMKIFHCAKETSRIALVLYLEIGGCTNGETVLEAGA